MTKYHCRVDIFSLHAHCGIFSPRYHKLCCKCCLSLQLSSLFLTCFYLVQYTWIFYCFISQDISVTCSFQEPLLHDIVYCSLFVQCFDLVYKEPSCVQRLTMSLSLISNLHAYRHIEVISGGYWTKESQIF